MQPPARIETDRLLLREPRLADADALYASYAADPEVSRYMTWRPHGSVQETRELLERMVEASQAGREHHWLIAEPATDRPCGVISLSRDNPFCFHLGYVLERAKWGQGLMTEAVRPIVEWVKEQPEIFRLYAVCDVENPGSARVLEKLKLRYEGLLRRAIMHVNAGPEPRDVHCFAWTR